MISDQRMPGMMGSEVLAKSRAIYPLARRVLLTAYSDIDAAVKAINEAHLDHYLSKPWDPPEERLFPAIDDLLDAWQAEWLPEAKGLRLVGHQWSPQSHAIKDFLASNLIPYRWLDVARDADARALLDAAGVGADELPRLFFDDGTPVLRNPDTRQVAERLGRPMIAAFDVYDLAIVGAGRRDLPRLSTARLRACARCCLTGMRPAARPAAVPASKTISDFPPESAAVSLPGARSLRRSVWARSFWRRLKSPASPSTADTSGSRSAMDVKLSRGPCWQPPECSIVSIPRPGIAEHTGAGVYYGAATTEAAAFRDRRVLIVGGGNSAGQGAMYLARYAKEVEIVVRRESLRDTMSQYLIEQIAKTPNIRLRPRTEIATCRGRGSRGACRPHFARRRIRRRPKKSMRSSSSSARVPAATGFPPRYSATPKDLSSLAAISWRPKNTLASGKSSASPCCSKPASPASSAAGDLRAGAMNRVASAVGEGSMVVRLAHEYLALT